MLRQWLIHPIGAWQVRRQRQAAAALHSLQSRYHTFRALLEDNNRAVSLLTDLGMRLRHAPFDRNAGQIGENLIEVTGNMVDKLGQLKDGHDARLAGVHARIARRMEAIFAGLPKRPAAATVIGLEDVGDDMHGLVGGKAAMLAKISRLGLCRVPAGFVIPLPACRLFLEQQNLNLQLTTLLHPFLHNATAAVPGDVAEDVKRRIMATPLPATLRQALADAASPFLAAEGGPGLAVRSSAVGEDGPRLSFAGQYTSVLNVVSLPDLERAVKEVIASSFNSRNLSYRLHAGLDPLKFDLAVLCLAMVQARSAGTMFTRDPGSPSSGKMLVSAVYGLGEPVVAGSSMPDLYRPQRATGHDPQPVIVRKERRLICSAAGGVREEPVALQDQDKPVLQPFQLALLCRWGLALEKLENRPQDIEWAVDADDEPVLLQARPFRSSGPAAVERVRPGAGRDLLLSGGVTASSGVGTGRIWMVRSRADLDHVPEEPYVLVMPQSLVDAVPALRKAGGVLVELGNPLDHLSCIAREYGIPMITGLGKVVDSLAGRSWVLVDGGGGKVYEALAADRAEARALAASATHREEPVETPADPAAAELYRLTVPLNLTDAYGPTFSIAECRTMHDLIRYIHEKAVMAMFSMGDETLEKTIHMVHHLQSDVPFFVSIIDLGGGLVDPSGAGRWIMVDDIASIPLKALWQGVSDPGVNWGPPAGGAAIGSVMSRFLSDHKSARPVGLPNYAIITRDYLNLNARMDFHFIMIDAVCSFDSSSNYIRLRFKGGGTTRQQRRRRVECIVEILAASGFACDARDDLVTADLKGAPPQVMEDKLTVLGRLLGFTRLLDAAMGSDEAPGRAAKSFLAGNYQSTADNWPVEQVR